MVSFKIVSVFLVCVYVDSIICGRHSYYPAGDEYGNDQNAHHIKPRTVLLKPLKRVIGRITGHLGLHHQHHPNCEDRHIHHYDGFPTTHPHNTDFGNHFHKESTGHLHPPGHFDGEHYGFHHGTFPDHQYPSNNNHDIHWFHKDKPEHPEFPVVNDHFPSDTDKKVHGFKNHEDGPSPGHDFNRPQFPDVHVTNEEKPDQKSEIPTAPHSPTGEKVTKKPVVYPPFDGNDDKDYPINDFDKRKEKNGRKPIVGDGSTVDLESDFSGVEDDGRRAENGSRDWVIDSETKDEVENKGSGEIPSTSQIDIRFRKD